MLYRNTTITAVAVAVAVAMFNPNPAPPALLQVNPPGAASTLVIAPPQGFPYLRVRGRELAPWCHSSLSHALLALPGHDVVFIPGTIQPYRIALHRLSYINAILIQSRGYRSCLGMCTTCANYLGPHPFPECRRVRGHFNGACANCKWRDRAAQCSYTRKDGTGPGNDDLSDNRHDRAGGGGFVEGEVSDEEGEGRNESRERCLLEGPGSLPRHPLVVD